jgi:CheY-like chemotaxis protein
VPQTLLLADDSVTIQRVIELTFADEAITVVAVSDGDQAIERIEADPPDIVLVDIGMPGRTGYEVAHHIKQSSRLKHIPVLLLTGAFEPVDQAKAAAAGCDGVLAKPFEPQLVIARVKELLLRGGHEVESPEPVSESSTPAPLPESAGSFETWGTPAPQVEPQGNSSPSEAQVARLDDYFDKLDAAFQNLGGDARTEPPKSPAIASPVAAIIDWFGGASAPSKPASDLPLSTAAALPSASPSPEPETEPEPVPELELEAAPSSEPERESEPEDPPDGWADAEEPAAPRFMSEPAPKTAAAFVPAPPSPSSLATLPPMADAFAAILAAEHHEPMPALWPGWPAPPQPVSNGGGAPSEDAIEEITRRVLDRLSDRVVRETAEDVISSIAERLVREEIERIKATIK